MKLIAIISFLLLSTLNCMPHKDKKTCDKICNFEEKLISEKISIDLLCKYKLNKLNYEEGVFYGFSYSDSTFIILFDGTNQSLPIFKEISGYTPLSKDTIDSRIITKGTKNGLNWREDKITSRVRVLYDAIPDKKKDIYDSILNSLILIND